MSGKIANDLKMGKVELWCLFSDMLALFSELTGDNGIPWVSVTTSETSDRTTGDRCLHVENRNVDGYADDSCS